MRHNTRYDRPRRSQRHYTPDNSRAYGPNINDSYRYHESDLDNGRGWELSQGGQHSSRHDHYRANHGALRRGEYGRGAGPRDSWQRDDWHESDVRNTGYAGRNAGDYINNYGSGDHYNPETWYDRDGMRYREDQPPYHYNYYESYPSYGQGAPYSDHERGYDRLYSREEYPYEERRWNYGREETPYPEEDVDPRSY
jgi:hypothetical protein